jgi:hypothetical protein
MILFHLIEALIKDIRIITLRGVDDGEERRELDKIMSVMILAKIHVNNRGKQHVVDQKKIRVLLLF